MKKSGARQSKRGDRIPFLERAFSGITIRDPTPDGTIFYASVLFGLVADFFNNIGPKGDGQPLDRAAMEVDLRSR
ncbi:MAG: hypothetical protein E5X21_04550 [Mesorhizobium sp.]|uniref:hypothetical protein n=1 Tax=Mesorhizobium sp. TaxID=1871066 RepID=UPI000FEA61C2|nr:hypothetical protein [Mesorhizobium sp.]RWG37804.1 MAG: hypothetical protein EOQ59_18155 [Mesorhizobium sp.]TIP22599.1 MAG: hypothetical protein E5X92_08290 [Mesorhizobium sp.]TIR62772.1 MAG: hypothetical protein E5X17_00370 [Mesorhizobium sp.]TIR74836.1 MAG: hypothetical protein E5X18_10595 [Mesorhizobium sp.]TIR79923.1 MAG: hypothetical protein E5X15_05620 [Mesorhizobium sp.]